MRGGPGIPRGLDAAEPAPGSGYYRGAPPKAGGQGSGMGPKGAGSRALISADGWTPTVTNLVVLVVLEVGAYALLRYAFRAAHGG